MHTKIKSIYLSLSVILIFIVLLAGCAGNQEEIIETPEITILPPEPEPEPEPDTEPQFLCPECGFELPSDAFFCYNCGAKVRDDGKELPWHTLASLDELTGTWTSDSGCTICYPDYSLDTAKPMISISFPEENDNSRWKAYADRNNTTMETLWEKKAAYRSAIDGEILTDENGTQAGYVLIPKMIESRYFNPILSIYRKLFIFVPEKIIRDNAASISVSPDGKKISLIAQLRFFSDIQQLLETPVDTFTLNEEEPENDEN